MDRNLAARSHYPAISVLASISRLMPAICPREVVDKSRRLRKLLAAYTAAEDLVRLGAYQKGLDPVLDQAVASLPAINAFLQQPANGASSLEASYAGLLAIPG